jgi:hypothetical protein
VFDCVKLELLLKKLQFCGVNGILFDWFKCYLYNRKQRVELKFSSTCSYLSTRKIVKCGVPPGSVMGPLLLKFTL